MTFHEFVRRWRNVQADFDRATWAHYTAAAVNTAAKNSQEVPDRLNQDARYWNFQVDCWQCGFFMALGRLFDTAAPDALTIYSLLGDAGHHAPALFSREALAVRKAGDGLSAEQVVVYMEGVTAEPRQAFKRLREHLAPAVSLYDGKYRKLRNEVFGHAIAARTTFAVDALYAQTDLIEIDGILYRLHEAIEGVFSLMHDGMERELNTYPPVYPNRIKSETFKMLGYNPTLPEK